MPAIKQKPTVLPSLDKCREMYKLLREKEWAKAIEVSGHVPPGTEKEQREFIGTIFMLFLHADLYEHAAAMIWSQNKFNLKSRSARRVWELMSETRQLLIMSAGAMGKSYTCGGWLLLDWLRDPTHTLTQIVSVTGGHAKKNLLGHIQDLYKDSAIDLVGKLTAEKIVIEEEKTINHGIILVTIQKGSAGTGVLRGLHPKNRSDKPHPKFGIHTRVRVFLDECEDVPEGVWEDLSNALTTLGSGDMDHVKIAGASNPKNPQSQYGLRCEPPNGWTQLSEDDEEWISGRKWHVYRIDAAKSENVIEGTKAVSEGRVPETVIPGLQTYEGYYATMADRGGEGSPGYWSQCRGMFPPEGAEFTIIKPYLIDEAQGEFIFEGPARPIGAGDLAFEGGDSLIFILGLMGLARRWKDRSGKIHPLRRERLCIQVTALFELSRGDGVEQADKIIESARSNSVNPYFLAVDATGTGYGTASMINKSFGGCLMVNYAEKATTEKIMLEDNYAPADLYNKIYSELWFAASRWLEEGLIKFGLSLPPELFREMAGRRCTPAALKKMAVEPKQKYKNRNQGKSPDRADAFTLLVHLARMRGEKRPGVNSDVDRNLKREYDSLGTFRAKPQNSPNVSLRRNW